ncbi:hypothetical protein CC78DRAFT_467399, partial [Lojkania enalia]
VDRGIHAPKVVPEYYLCILHLTIGEIWKAIDVPAGMFIWLFSFWLCALFLVRILTTTKNILFTLSWRYFISPSVELTVALIRRGGILGSDGIKGIKLAMKIVLVILWSLVAIETLKRLWKVVVLSPGMDEDLEDVERCHVFLLSYYSWSVFRPI